MGEERRELVVFDGDDTLWRTQEIYDEIKSAFVDRIRGWNLPSEEALATLDRIDADAASVRGFTIDRFVDSMVRTYRLLSEQAHETPNTASENDVRSLAAPLLGDYQLYPDALDTIRRLRPYFELVLATKGERKLQERKVHRLGLGKLFSHVYFVDQKTEVEYVRILSQHRLPADMAWAVGNSLRSDINPAISLGMPAIWIRRRGWIYEQASPIAMNVPIVDSLSEAADLLIAHRNVEARIGIDS